MNRAQRPTNGLRARIVSRAWLRVKRYGNPPTIKYLTFRTLKMGKSSLKSLNMECRFLHLVRGKSELRNGTHALVGRQPLPVLNLVRLHGVQS